MSERKELDRLRDDLSAMIYHDLRSPLANVISSLDIMLASQEDETFANATLIQIAYRSAERMQRLISALLDISRLEAGQSILKPKITEARTLLQEALKLSNQTLKQNSKPHRGIAGRTHISYISMWI